MTEEELGWAERRVNSRQRRVGVLPWVPCRVQRSVHTGCCARSMVPNGRHAELCFLLFFLFVLRLSGGGEGFVKGGDGGVSGGRVKGT